MELKRSQFVVFFGAELSLRMLCLAALLGSLLADIHPGAGYGKVCRGTNTALSHDHDSLPWDRYVMYQRRYSNCTYIDGNLEIVFLDGNYDYDMSFLKDIQEVTGYVLILGNYADYIPLTSLRIIRGRTLYSGPEDPHSGFSLFVAHNYKPGSLTVGLKELQLVSLHEIIDGNVIFLNNNLLCFENTINWKDILTGENSEVIHHRNSKDLPRECGQCHGNCTNGRDRNCWGEGPNMCQTLTKLNCSPQCDDRCYGTQANQCCHPECAGGCDGPTKNDCWACKNFVDNRTCVAFCPVEYIYDPSTYRKKPNENAKYSYGTICVQKCPGHLMADRGACVSDCGTGRQADPLGKCTECDGPCPKPCPGIASNDFINPTNINNFTGCTVIQGAIRILPNTFTGDPSLNLSGIHPSQLRVLESVQEVTDYILIQAKAEGFRNLSFLSNLRVIRGRLLDIYGMSLHIYDTSLESLALHSLKSIHNGGVFINNNPRLCYVDTIRWDRIRSNSNEKLIMVANANSSLCARSRRVCSSECTPDGCWGIGDSQCLACAHYRYGNRCLRSCNDEEGLYVAVSNGSSGECGRCHPECLGICRGLGADDCNACRHVRDGPYCVSECPSSKYASANGTCMPCHDNCADGAGCTGSLNTVGPGACNSCSLVRFTNDLPGGAVRSECLPADADCGAGFYRGLVPTKLRGPGIGKQGCLRCDPECRTCSGPGPSFCGECVHLIEDDRCVANCSADYYYDAQKATCRRCDLRCLRCTGSTESDCVACRHFKIYYRISDDVELKLFNCTDKCPVELPHKATETMSGDPETICTEEPVDDKRQQVGVAVGVVVGCLVLIGIIAVPIVYLRRQWARAEENKLRLTARMSGLDESEVRSEPLTPSDAKPDMAMLRLIKESELRRGNIIGSGAFGTVYKGVWVPEGENVKIPVAIKALQEGTAPAQNKELLEEARVMASVVHPCCVRILAVCMTAQSCSRLTSLDKMALKTLSLSWDDTSQVMLVTPLVPLGALLDYVRRHRTNISSKALLNWSTQIAKGMSYLEERGIVHRDLAARNVLVQSPNQVKITDFGLAKLLDYNEDGYRAAGGKMPIKWLALECIQYRIFTHKSDVWSFGVTMWELFTYGQRPYENVRAKDISDLLEKGERLPQPSICTIDVYMIMIKCWMLDADSRPAFRELADEFAKMARDPGRYLVIPGDKLMRLPSHTYDTMDLVRNMSIPADGPEEVITAEEYLQPQGAAVRNQRMRATCGGTMPYHINGALELPLKFPRRHHGRPPNRPFTTAQENSLDDDMHCRSAGGRRARPRPQGGTSSRDSPYFFPPPQRHWRGGSHSDNSMHTQRAVSPSRQDCDTVTTTTSVDASPTKETQISLQLPVDEDDYLQPQRSKTTPVYLDLIDTSPPISIASGDNSPTAKESPVDCIDPQLTETALASPSAAIDNPEYFDDLLTGNGSIGDCAISIHEGRPLRLRSQSTESTASDHDEYDRLNCSPSQPTPANTTTTTTSLRNIENKQNGIHVPMHIMFTESVL